MGDYENPDPGGDVQHLDADAALLQAMESASEADNGEDPARTDPAEADAATREQSGDPQSATVNRGQAPDNRIQAAVKNARAETRAEVEKQYAAFKGMDPEQVQTAMSVLGAMREDPRAFAMELVSRLGLKLSEEAPKQEQTPVAEFKLPPADLVSADGKLRTFSEAAVANIMKDLTNHVLSQVEGRLNPVQEFIQTEERTRAEAQETERQRQAIVSAVEDIRELPHFDEKGVLEVLRAMGPAERQRMGPVASLRKAYLSYTKEKVLPTINTAAETRVRDQSRRKAAASSGAVRPGQNAGQSQTPRLESVDDLAAHMERLAATVDS